MDASRSRRPRDVALQLEILRAPGRLELDGRDRRDSLLILHAARSASVAVRKGESVRAHGGHADRVDYLPAGSFEQLTIAVDDGAVFLVTIPEALERAVVDEGGWPAARVARQQISDSRLRKLLAGVVHARTQADERLRARQAVALVDRLHETALPHALRPKGFSATMRRLLVDCIEDIHCRDALELSALAGLTQTQFCKVFRDTFGVAPHHYLVDRQIAIARDRLAAGMRIGPLAHELGFSSHSHFTTVFRKATGQTPSEFAKDARAVA